MNISLFSRRTLVEQLEQRIAPAAFLINNNFEIKDSKGNDITNQYQDFASDADAYRALLLKKSDILYYDTDGDGVINKKVDQIIVQVKAGGAMTYFVDLGKDGKFDPAAGEIGGLAVAASTNMTVNTGIQGDVATILTLPKKGDPLVSTDSLLQGATITGLNIDGFIGGFIYAGGTVSNVQITKADVDGTSVQGIVAGTAVTGGEVVDFGNGGKTFTLDAYEAAPGEAGAGIQNVTLAGGTNMLHAGSGGDATDLSVAKGIHGGAGGFVRNVTIGATLDGLSVRAGDGGDSIKANGGAGGTISNITVNGIAGEVVEFISGDGGSGNGSSGAGGSVSAIALNEGGTIDSLKIEAGNGGTAVPGEVLDSEIYGYGKYIGGGAGGAGGSVTGVTVDALGIDKASVRGGMGGDGDYFDDVLENKNPDKPGKQVIKGGVGGNGGAVAGLTLGGTVGTLQVMAGDGGLGAYIAAGGNGGGISNVSATVVLSAELTAGNGNEGGDNGGQGGLGGAVSQIALVGVAADTPTGWLDGSSVIITAGSGNAGGARNGSGGSVTGVTITNAAFEEVAITAGDGADADFGEQYIPGANEDKEGKYSYRSSPGGQGGSVTNSTVQALAVGNVSVLAGRGGDGFFDDYLQSAGGDAGRISGLNVSGKVDAVALETQSGGYGLSGGTGGAISDITVSSLAESWTFDAVTGFGGDTGDGLVEMQQKLKVPAVLNAGAGGSITGLNISNTDNATISLETGSGGSAYEIELYVTPKNDNKDGKSTYYTGSGGNAGSVSNLTLSALVRDLYILTGNGGASSGTNAGRSGGTVDFANEGPLTISNALSIETGSGGDGGLKGGVGGDGGSILNLTVYGVAADTPTGYQDGSFISLITGSGASGVGGNGLGGSIAQLSIVDGAFESIDLETGSGGDSIAELVEIPPKKKKDPVERVAVSAEGGDGGAITNAAIHTNSAFVNVITGSAGAGLVEELKYRPSIFVAFTYYYAEAAGGDGGEIGDFTLTGNVGEIVMETGFGGDGYGTGTGGALNNVTIDSSAEAWTLGVVTGDGGEGLGTNGGQGGSINGLVLNNSAVGSVEIVLGSGGASSEELVRKEPSYGRGGDAGSLVSIAFEGNAVADLALIGGSGGDSSGDFNGAHGTSWDLSGMGTLIVSNSLTVIGGEGGMGGDLGGRGGNGGLVAGVNVQGVNAPTPEGYNAGSFILLEGGIGGEGSGGLGSAGSIYMITITESAFETIEMFAAPGLNAINGEDGGNGGDIFSIELDGAAGSVSLVAGSGGDGLANADARTNGGWGGGIWNFAFNGTIGEVYLEGGLGGSGANGGWGGAVYNITGKSDAESWTFQAVGGDGGDATGGNASFGGSLYLISLDGTDKAFVELITGAGGSATTLQIGDQQFSGMGGFSGSIYNVQFADEVFDLSLTTGDGGSSAGTNHGRDGGSINLANPIKIINSLTVVTGNGGDAGELGGVGGSGGAVGNLWIEGFAADTPEGYLSGSFLDITTGNGAAGLGGAGSGGNISLTITNGAFEAISLVAGDGAQSLGTTAGGAGGSLMNVSINAFAASLSATAGAGGDGVADNTAQTKGGTAGQINGFSFSGKIESVELIGGAGGSGFAGASGGNVSNVSGQSSLGEWSLSVQGGEGGIGNGSNGGAGGSIFDLSLQDAAGASVELIGGDGGSSNTLVIDGEKFSGTGGVGGAVSGLSFDGPVRDLSIQGGAGGSSSGEFNGAAGGSIDLATTKAFAVAYSLTIQGGQGGENGELGGVGGAGGSVSNVSFKGVAADTPEGYAAGSFVDIQSGEGSGERAAAGSISNITLAEGAFETIDLITAAGGNATVSGSGVAGGNVQNVAISSTTATLTIETGAGGSGLASDLGTTSGGAGGSVQNVTVGGKIATISVETGEGGEGFSGGAGGSVSQFTVESTADKSSLTLSTGRGGDASGGNAGAGGVIQGLGFGADGIAAADISTGDGGDASTLVLNATVFSGMGGAGGGISDVHSVGSVGEFVAVTGSGGKGAEGKAGGAGGSIDFGQNNKLTIAQNLSLTTGAGGEGEVGGDGGSVSNVHILGVPVDGGYAAGSAIAVETGEGASGATSNGAGGSIAHFSVTNGAFESIAFSAGDGASAVTGGAGGAAGNILNVAIESATASVTATAGQGGSGLTTADLQTHGADGGKIDGFTFGGNIGQITLEAGAGGTGQNGGTGGSVGNVSGGSVAEAWTLEATAGTGGEGSGGHGGTGGSIGAFTLSNTGAADVALNVGSGGNSSMLATIDGVLAGKGGDSGNITAPVFQDAVLNLTIIGGNGGMGFGSFDGGTGGSINLENSGKIIVGHSLTLIAGEGGNSGPDGGKGGHGGSISNATVAGVETDNPAGYNPGSFVTIQAGEGASGVEANGAGGNVSKITVAEGAFESIDITAGDGSDAVTGGAGGDGGSLVGINIHAHASFVKATAGNGGTGLADDVQTAGGDGGAITDFSFSGKINNVTLQAGDGSFGATGGTGGSVAELNGSSDIENWTLEVVAGEGGSSKAGDAGAGGSIIDVNLTAASTASVELTAGKGGFADASGAGGDGGSIVDFDSTGVIGEFTATAGQGGDGAGADNGGMGGKVDLGTEAAPGKLTISKFATMVGGAGGIGGNDGGVGGVGGSVANMEIYGVLSPNPQGYDPGTFVTLNAGEGGAGAGGNGAGGNVSKVTIADGGFESIDVNAGAGANADVGSAGGDGGSVTGVIISTATAALKVEAGAGGTGLPTTAGGDGGNIVNVIASGAIHKMELVAGAGAVGLTGGHGGSIQQAILASTIATWALDATAGEGAIGVDGGGNGGSIENLHIQANATGKATLTAGEGGTGDGNGAGGKGGSILDIVTIGAIQDLNMKAGVGGDALNLFAGGEGGSILKVDIDAVTLATLEAGDGGSGSAQGGKGGSIVGIEAKNVGNAFIVSAGDGGDAPGLLGPGGDGGDVDKVTTTGGDLVVSAGSGGAGDPEGANGVETNIVHTP